MSSGKPKVSARDVIVIAAILAVLAFPAPAFAYIDPGLGSAIVASVLGFVAAIGYWLRAFLARLKDRLSGKSDDSANR